MRWSPQPAVVRFQKVVLASVWQNEGSKPAPKFEQIACPCDIDGLVHSSAACFVDCSAGSIERRQDEAVGVNASQNAIFAGRCNIRFPEQQACRLAGTNVAGPGWLAKLDGPVVVPACAE
mmetsp:Transcript_140280/g.355914  ORF Transcript_140280/g.355914 Transcript_140280/m.355914 type:complete len:120 (-) Transcript_140280:737-1096(-)